jgi:putative membrane protein
MRKTGLLLAATLVASPAYAQTVEYGDPGSRSVALTTPEFIKEAAQNDLFEVESSKLAVGKTQGLVKEFADRMVMDHTKSATDLKRMAQSAGIELPEDVSSLHRALLNHLRGLSANDFAKQYITDQIGAHKYAVSLLSRYRSRGENLAVKAWANRTLPDLQHHLEMAQDLKSRASAMASFPGPSGR